jgi:hypothetical protein
MSTPGIGSVTDVIANLPAIFYDEGQYLWNYQAQHVAMSKKRKGRGPAINWTVSNGTILVQNRPAGYTVNPPTDVQNTDRVKLTLNRGIYSTQFGFTDDELATVESYLGSDALADVVRDLWGSAYVEHLAGITRQFEIDTLVGTGSTTGSSGGSSVPGVSNITGYLSFLGSSGTYGGETFGGSTNPGLISTVYNMTSLNSGNVTRAYIRQMFAGIKQATGWNPDYIEASPLTATYLNGIGDNQIRYFNNSDRELFQTDAQVLMKGMDTVTSILGVPVIENTAWGVNSLSSPGANTDGYVLFGAKDKTLYDILTYDRAQDAFLSEIREATSKADNQPALPVGVPVRCWAYAKTAASKIVVMDVSLGMVCLAPNRFGLMTGVTGFTPN